MTNPIISFLTSRSSAQSTDIIPFKKPQPSLESAVTSFCSKAQDLDLPKTTHYIFVLDESGSMGFGKEVTLDGYNSQISTILENIQDTGDTYVTLISFNSDVTLNWEEKKAKEVSKLTSADYRPNGNTALYDAIGVAIERALSLTNVQGKDTGVLISVLTDGAENASKYIKGDEVGKCITALEKTDKFTFALMGPNQHLESIAQILSVEKGNIAGFDPNSISGKMGSMQAMTCATASYSTMRGANLKASKSFYSVNSDENSHQSS